MNFTREPIIETIITPKEGSKLVIRSSKGEGQEEYHADAVEVVSFGQALFFRSTERPKAFLVPVGDYEVVETKESRVVLKNAQFERNIKIGGGREAPIRREAEEELEAEVPAETEGSQEEGAFSHKRDRHRRRRRKPHEEREELRARVKEASPESGSEEKPAASETEQTIMPVFPNLLPPPTTLISESIKKYKETLEPVPEAPASHEKKEDEGESEPMHRMSTPDNSSSDWDNFLP